jgi:hypothetical protein
MLVGTVIGAAVLLVALVAAFVLRKADRAPAPLRDDWWPDFEREFRVYVQRHARPAAETRGERPAAEGRRDPHAAEARRERPGRGSHRHDNG